MTEAHEAARGPSGAVHSRTLRLALALPLAALYLPFFLHVPGDVEIHLAAAERFVEGRPFSFDGQLATVVASTSPFWTLVATGLVEAFGAFAPLALKILVLAIAGATAWMLHRIARDQMKMDASSRRLLLISWLASVPIAAHALGGLENILSALQVLLALATCSTALSRGWRPADDLRLGLIVGWAWLTRPDGGLFALLVVLLAQVTRVRRSGTGSRAASARSLGLIAAIALLLAAPWYAWQWRVAGSLVAHASLSRLYAGHRLAWTIVPGWVELHPNAILTLIAGFLPLVLGSALVRAGFRKPAARPARGSAGFVVSTGLLLIPAGAVLYTFFMGAEHAGRYLLPILPLVFLLGFEGLGRISPGEKVRLRPFGLSPALVAFAYLLAVSAVDFHRRVAGNDRFSLNLRETIEAPARRRPFTDRLLAALGREPSQSARLAVTEAQIRWYADERITVIGLDGRTCSEMLSFIEPRTGVPDFAGAFERLRPDFVEVGQWREAGGWMPSRLRSRQPENLLGAWHERIASMSPGESFLWKGRRVIYVRDEIVRIDWTSG